MKSTIHDIAKGLQLNASTVSRALRGHTSVSKETQRRVLAKAKELNYQPNRIAAALRAGKSKILGVIVPVTDRTFFASIIRGIEEKADAAGYRVVVAQSHEDSRREIKAAETLAELQVDGLLVALAKDNGFQPEVYDQLQQQGIAVQFFDTAPIGYQAGSVTSNDYLGAMMATNHLISQGYQRIAHLKGSQFLHTYRDRTRGYRDALAAAGLPYETSLEIEVLSQREEGYRAFELFQQQPQLPDAVFSSSDFAALGLLQAAQAAGVSIPEEMGIVGYANEPFTEFVNPALSTVDQNSRQMGMRTAERILSLIENGESLSESNQHDQLVLMPQLIIRASSVRNQEK